MKKLLLPPVLCAHLRGSTAVEMNSDSAIDKSHIPNLNIDIAA
jgi:hypothetical protein